MGKKNQPDRRTWLKSIAAGSLGLWAAPCPAAVKEPIPFGFSLYGMKSLELKSAIQSCGEIGFQAIELALMPGWPSEPKLLAAADRKQIRGLLSEHKLKLVALMENLHEPAEDSVHLANKERLKAAAQLAHDLVPDQPPLIETVLGGKPDQWEKSRQRLVDRIGAWAELGRSTKTVIAVKAHVGNAMHTPAAARWLHDQIKSDWLKLAYDYSHFSLRGFSLAESVATVILHSVFVHIKDAKGTPEKFDFLLPGEGTIDYAHYFRLLRESSYRGAVMVEVSGLISNRPGYDPIATAKKCFKNMASHLHLLK